MPRQTNSAKKTSLNAVEQYELNQWLEQNHINSTNLRRSFTDVLPLARLLARYYPDLIDLNYYPPRNSVQNKLCNWESFNKRVLARLGVNLTREQMVRVARSVPGSVDLLLYSIMRVQMAAERKAREAKGSTDDDDNDDNDDDDNDNNADDDDNVIKHSDNKVAATAHEQQAAAHVEPAKKTVVLSNLNNNDDDDDAKDDDDDDVDDDDDDNNAGAAAAAAGGQAMRSKPNMPKTLKLAQAALKRSERAQMEQRRGVATGILARARGNPSSPSSNSNSPNNRRLTIAGSETGRGAGGGGGGGGGAVSATVAMDLNVAHRQRGEQQQQKQQQRTVLYSHYMQAVKQLQQKNEKIARFDQLSAHLENMLQLKCERIDELQQQVANAVNCLKPGQLKVTQNNSNNNNNNNSNNNNSNNNHNNSDSNNNTSRTHSPTQKRRTRLKKRLVCNTTNNSIEHKAGTIAIPGIGIAGASFPVKLSQFH